MADADTSKTQATSPDASTAQAASASSQVSADASQQTQIDASAPARPDGLGDAFWDEKAGVKLPDLIKAHGELSALKAGLDAKAAAVPESADKYQTTLPADFKMPDGWNIDAEAPLWKAGKEFAKANGLTQEQFSGLAKLYVEGQVAEKVRADGEIATAVKARDTALGANGPARVEALKTWFNGAFGEAIGKQLAQTLFTPDIVGAFEKLQTATVSQGLTSFNQTGRAQGRADGKPDNWDQLSPVDRHTWHLTQKSEARKTTRN